ncbi:MAG: hypothetical protein IJ298_05300 [Ruminococcus sp.]|nr:hypothetical protein [Ruminococcus sp.]
MKAKTRSDKTKSSRKPLSIILSVVSIIELIVLLTTMTFAWFEGLTSLEITGENLTTASGLKSKFIVGEGTNYQTTAKLNEFFHSQSFDKISPVSSYGGDEFYALTEGSASSYQEYVDGVTNQTLKFRKLSDEEKNSSIIQFQFEITSDSSDTDFWFKELPTVKINGTALNSENNPFRFCFDDGTGAATNSANNYNMTTRTAWPTGGRAAIRAVKSIDDNGYATLNDTASGDLITNRACFSVFGSSTNKNGTYKLFTVPKNQNKIITVSIWLEAFDPAYNENIIPPGATVEFGIEFCSSWDVVDTITFRDYTADQWINTTNGTDTQRLGVVNLDSDSNYWYGNFTYNEATHAWTGDIPRAVQNIKFVWQNANDNVEDASWTAATRGKNTTFTVFGSAAGMWYADGVTKITLSDYTSDHWLYSSDTKMRVQITYNGSIMDYSMTASPTADSSGKNTWAAFIPSSIDTVVFNRCNSSDTSTALNTWNGTGRGTETRYYALDGGEVEVVEGTAIYLTIPNAVSSYFFYQNYTPAVSQTSSQNRTYILSTLNGDRSKIHQDNYRVTGSPGSEQDIWLGDQGKMTKVTEDSYGVTYVFYFDSLADGTYLSFWNRPQVDHNNLDNDTKFAPCFQFNASEGNEFVLFSYTQLTQGGFTDAWVFTDVLVRDYTGSGGNTTKPGVQQVGQWGPPDLPVGTYQTNFYHTSTTATNVSAKFEYYGVEYTIDSLTQSNSDKRLWYATAGSIPDDVTVVTFTDNNGNSWTVDNTTGSRTSSTNYYYATSSNTGKWSAKITPPSGSYTTYFVPLTGSTASTVTASFTYDGVPFTVSLTKGSDGNWSTTGIPDSVTSITFTDNLGNTWSNTTGRSSSANYYMVSSTSAGTWGKPASAANMIYLNPGVWNTANAWYALYVWNDSGSTWAKMSDSDGDGIYECEIPDGYSTNIIFCRMDPAKTALDWGSKWNQTYDLTMDGTNNLYSITGWVNNSDKSTGSWSTK